MKRFYLISFVLVLLPSLTRAQGPGTNTVTSQVGVTVAVEAALTILPTPSTQTGAAASDAVRQGTAAADDRDVTMLTSSGGTLSDYVGTTSFTYFIRTGSVSGSGFIKLQVTSDFSPAGGPSVSTPLTAGDTLRYSCAMSSPGTACSGLQFASISSQTPVGTFPKNAHSGRNGNTASIFWMLSNDPLYETGTYIATVTYTISAS